MPNSRIAGAGGWLAEKTASATSMSAPSSKADHPRAAGDRRWPCSFSRTSRTPSATWSPWVPYGPDRLAQPVEPSTAQPCSPSSSPNRTEQSRSLPGAPSATQHADAESSAACPFHHPAHDGAGYPGQTEVQAPGNLAGLPTTPAWVRPVPPELRLCPAPARVLGKAASEHRFMQALQFQQGEGPPAARADRARSGTPTEAAPRSSRGRTLTPAPRRRVPRVRPASRSTPGGQATTSRCATDSTRPRSSRPGSSRTHSCTSSSPSTPTLVRSARRAASASVSPSCRNVQNS